MDYVRPTSNQDSQITKASFKQPRNSSGTALSNHTSQLNEKKVDHIIKC